MYNKKIPVDTSCGFGIALEVMSGCIPKVL